MPNDTIEWKFNNSDKLLYRLDVIDTSFQFKRAKIFKKEIVRYTINYDLSCSHPEITNGQIKFDLFRTNDYDFFLKYCDVKIRKIVLPNNTLYQVLNHPNLFKSCLFTMYPIYYCLKLKNDLFSNQEVKCNHYTDNQVIRLPNKYISTEELFLVDTLSNFDLNIVPIPMDPFEFWACFICSLYIHPFEDYAYKIFIKNWHAEKNILLPELFIKKIDNITFKRLLIFFYHFVKTFYNNDMAITRTRRNIKACWAKKISNPKRILQIDKKTQIINTKLKIDNDGMLLADRFCLKLFPGILVKQNQDEKFEYCLFYQTNIPNIHLYLKLVLEYAKKNTKRKHEENIYFKSDSSQLTFMTRVIDFIDNFSLSIKFIKDDFNKIPFKILINNQVIPIENQYKFIVKKNIAESSFNNYKENLNEFVLLKIPSECDFFFKNLTVKQVFNSNTNEDVSTNDDKPNVNTNDVDNINHLNLLGIQAKQHMNPKNFSCFLKNMDFVKLLNDFYDIKVPDDFKKPLGNEFPFNYTFRRNDRGLTEKTSYIPIEDLNKTPSKYWVKRYFYDKTESTTNSNKYETFYAGLQYFGHYSNNLPSSMYSIDSIEYQNKNNDQHPNYNQNTIHLDEKKLIFNSLDNLNSYFILSSFSILNLSFSLMKNSTENGIEYDIRVDFLCKNDYEKNTLKIQGGVYHIIKITYSKQNDSKLNFKFIENSLPFENSINFKRSIDISNSNNNEYEKLYIYIVLEKYNLNQSAHLAIEFDNTYTNSKYFFK